MGKPDEPTPGLLFAGLLWTDDGSLEKAVSRLSEEHGPMLLATPREPFRWSDYYEPEMGPGIMRSYAFFRRLLHPGDIAGMKLAANALEEELKAAAGREGRVVNLDPGYLTMDKLVLATTKPRSHRIYVGGGIHAESTLEFDGGAYRAWRWTYPDYARPVLRPFFTAARNTLKRMLQ